MERRCENENCGAIFTAYKNQRLCDDCANLLDFGTIIMEGYEEEKDKNGIPKSKNIGFFFLKGDKICFEQTKYGVQNMIRLKNTELLKPLLDEFCKIILKSPIGYYDIDRGKTEILDSETLGLFLEDGKIFHKQRKNGAEIAEEYNGSFLYPKIKTIKKPVFIAQCTVCENKFLTFANNSKYCPDCKQDKHAEQNRKYGKVKKDLRRLTPEEYNKLEKMGIDPKNYDFGGGIGRGGLGQHRDPDEGEELRKVEAEMRRRGLKKYQ